MFNVTKKSLKWGDKELVLESGKIARQADGSVLVTYGVKRDTSTTPFAPTVAITY